jgi:hypothetical protein
MQIEQYIHQFCLQQREEAQSSAQKETLNEWIYQHPMIVKATELAGMILGVGSILSLPVSFPVLGIGAVVIAVGGGIVALVSFVAYQVLDILIPPHHSMQQHVFKPAVHEAGKLYYQGDIPILELNCDDPYQGGLAHGYLLGKSLDHLFNQLNFIKKFAHLPNANQVPETLKAVRETLPEEYIQELQGVVDGFNQWTKENKWLGARHVTIEDLILFHLMPDSLHFSSLRLESNLLGQTTEARSPQFLHEDKDFSALGCTVVIDQDEKEGLTFGRNMDWPSFGIFGTYSLIINRKHTDKQLSTVELGFPGFVGTLTGMNQEGLSLAMNVCSGQTPSVRGMPAAFFNRFCLENCHDLAEVEELLEKENPLGSYHLSIADANSAKSFHLYQGEDEDHIHREWQVGQPLITTNCQYPSDQTEAAHMHCSRERKQIIQELFKGAVDALESDQIENAKLVQASLSLPFVDNSITTHKVVMYPQSKRIQLAVDNAFAGRAELQELNTEFLFS